MTIRERYGDVPQPSLSAWTRWNPVRWAAVIALALVLVGAVAAPASAHVRLFLGLGVPVYPYPSAYPYPAGYAYPARPAVPSYYPAYAPYQLRAAGRPGRVRGHCAWRRDPWGRRVRVCFPARWR